MLTVSFVMSNQQEQEKNTTHAIAFREKYQQSEDSFLCIIEMIRLKFLLALAKRNMNFIFQLWFCPLKFKRPILWGQSYKSSPWNSIHVVCILCLKLQSDLYQKKDIWWFIRSDQKHNIYQLDPPNCFHKYLKTDCAIF